MQTSAANLKLNCLWQTLTLDQHQRKFSLALRGVWTFSRSDFAFHVNIICDILLLLRWLFFCGRSPLNGSLLFAELWLDAKAWRDCEMPSNLAGPEWLPVPDAGCWGPLPGSLSILRRGVRLLPLPKRTVLSFPCHVTVSLPAWPVYAFIIMASAPLLLLHPCCCL